MFIKVNKNAKTKSSTVYLVEGYRDEKGKVKHRIIKRYGNLEDLVAKDPNILNKLKAEAKMIPKSTVNLELNLSELNSSMENDKNYGYFFLEKIYKELGITDFLKQYPFLSKHTFNIDKILKLLVYGRILNPASKKETVNEQKKYFTPFNVTLDSVYSSLALFDNCKEDLQYHINQKVSDVYGRDISLVFYDVTNYYFEIDKEDDLKRNGISKDGKKKPLVQMGLLIDKNGLPIAYKLFRGNMNDIITLIPFMNEMKKKFNFGKVILTADKGLNSGKNLLYLKSNKDGYIVSQKVRGASKDFVGKILEEDGYKHNKKGTFKIKSFLRDREVKDENGKIEILKEKVVCFWSESYDKREKKKREKLEERIQEYLEAPSKYTASNRYGIKKYLELHTVNTETGEIDEEKTYLKFDKEKYDNDVELDGYYAIITSELDLTEEEVIEKYRGLWKIEESFKVLKSDLEGRPVYVRKNDHVEGHFLICFIALLIVRILELKLEGKYSVSRIQESLKAATCRKFEKSIYSLNKQDEVYHDIEKAFGVSLNQKYVRLEQLREYKKAINHNI